MHKSRVLRSVSNRIEFLKAKLSQTSGGCDTVAKAHTPLRFYGGGAWLDAARRNTAPALTMRSGWHSSLELHDGVSQGGDGGWGGGYSGGGNAMFSGSRTLYGGEAVDAMWSLWNARVSGRPEDLLGRAGGRSFLYFYEARCKTSLRNYLIVNTHRTLTSSTLVAITHRNHASSTHSL